MTLLFCRKDVGPELVVLPYGFCPTAVRVHDGVTALQLLMRSGSFAFTLGLVLLLLYRLLVMMIVYNVTMTVVPRVYFLDVGDDFSQLDEASVQHDSQLGAGRPLGRAGCQEGLQGLQQHRHSLCHCRHGLQRSGVTLEAEHNEPPQSLHKKSQ